MKLVLAGLLISSVALAQKNDLAHRPKSFSTGTVRAVFVDFITADYSVVYDGTLKTASVTATINFDAPESGNPIFDLVEAPTSIKLDGEMVTATESRTPNGETTLRVINKSVATGSHTMTITAPLTSLVKWEDGGVKSAFWTSDLDEREFLERYLPANLEYDQVKMTFSISFEGLKAKQKIFTNGTVKEARTTTGKVLTKITYPEYYNASSIFFHTVPEGAVDEVRFSVKSIDGREIPGIVYASRSIWGGAGNLNNLRDKAIRVFQELESDYGAWLHPQLIIYNAGSGGMEYCGATMTDSWALGHEMFHSYFARGVMPANGNSGWLDEALASWRDDGYLTASTLSGSSQMSSHPYYTRTTDTAAYSFGSRFMSYLDGKIKTKGGLKPFLRMMIDNHKFAPLFVEDFSAQMSSFYGVDVGPDFKTYTYGNKNNFKAPEKMNPLHRKLSVKELENYL